MGDDRKSIITSAVADPASIDVSSAGRPARTHSGEWVVPPSEALRKLQRSKREVIERIYAEQREYFEGHAEAVDAIKRSDEYVEHVAKLTSRARVAAVIEGHWAHGNPTRYVEVFSAAFIWAMLTA